MADDREGAQYLGDGAYVRRSGGHEIELFSHNGIRKTNSVYLGNVELAALFIWLKSQGVGKF